MKAMRVSNLSSPEIVVGDRRIGAGSPCFVIAEAGINHNGDPNLAACLIDVAAEAGADAVKFQTFRAISVIAPTAPKAAYQLRTTAPEESQLEMVRKCELSDDSFRALAAHCRDRGLLFLSTPFDATSVDFLLTLHVPAIKIASGEVTNFPLLRHIGRTGKPLLLSTGMSDLDEVAAAVAELRRAGGRELALLHCVSNYPAAARDANLRAMRTMAKAFAVPVGYSDHTRGFEVAFAGVALGAAIIEKHFTLDRRLPGPDHPASLEPAELKELIAGIRRIEAALGDGVKAAQPSEDDTRRVARRSLYWARAMKGGEIVAAGDLVALRPADGVSPVEIDRIVGQCLSRDRRPGERFAWSDLAVYRARPADREPVSANGALERRRP
jgi:N-acetylneuraminate synthase/N,N'-diacetyllegionaminate synthase